MTRRAGLLPLALAAVHLPFITRYGYFRDELYYLACADHLSWGYVDHPPLSVAVLWAWRAVFGHSLVALRVPPILAGAATMWMAGRTAKALGGSAFAQTLAMLSVLVAPIYLALFHFYSMNSFDVLVWTVAGYLVIKIGEGPAEAGPHDRRLAEAGPHVRDWILLGVILGLGLQNKISVLWLAAGIAAAVVVTPMRRRLRTPWPWLAAAIAAALFAPYAIWNALHGWPTLEFIRNASAQKMKQIAPLDFVAAQVMMMNPVSVVVWGAAFIAALPFDGLRGPRARRGVEGSATGARSIAVIYVVVLMILLANRTSRPEYLAAAYPMLFASGAVSIARWSSSGSARAAVCRLLVAVLLVVGAAAAPLVMPVLPVGTFIRYQAALGIEPATNERKRVGPLPQHFADMHGWEDMVAAVARANARLSPDERAQAIVYAQNYGEAGAIDLLGRRYGLPPAASGHNNYWLWGTRGRSAQVNIILGGEREDHEQAYEEVVEAARVECGLCMPYENGNTVFIARRLKHPVAELWPRTRHYD